MPHENPNPKNNPPKKKKHRKNQKQAEDRQNSMGQKNNSWPNCVDPKDDGKGEDGGTTFFT